MNNTSTAYASARLDGALDCETLKIGILKTPPQSTPVVTFHILAGLQRHPVWALDRLAAIVYCYCMTARKHEQLIIEVNLTANLVSGSETVCIIASNIHWHTSKEIRNQAEGMAAAMACLGPRWVDQWPSKDAMQMPIVRKP